jgi:hypothetical protein
MLRIVVCQQVGQIEMRIWASDDAGKKILQNLLLYADHTPFPEAFGQMFTNDGYASIPCSSVAQAREIRDWIDYMDETLTFAPVRRWENRKLNPGLPWGFFYSKNHDLGDFIIKDTLFFKRLYKNDWFRGLQK